MAARKKRGSKRRTSSKQTAAKTAAKTAVAKIEQSHGGALYAGGVPGNRGGSRPPSEVRRISREAYTSLIPTLHRIGHSDASRDADRIAAAVALGRFGLSGSVSMDDVRERLSRTIAYLREHLPTGQAEEVIDGMAQIWRTSP